MSYYVKTCNLWCFSLLIACASLFSNPLLVSADLVSIVNNGFEDVTGMNSFNEFYFGISNGWTRYDPNGIQGAGVFWGVLEPNGVDFYSETAPEGDQVSLLFLSQRKGDGELGLEQTLGATLQANTSYSLSVSVGNIASGTASNGSFGNLDEFPGYRIDLLAGGVVVAQDDNSLNIAEGVFATSTIELNVGSSHAQLGQSLGIRLVNLNEIPAGFTQVTSPDLEVNFDLVQLNATAIPEPSSLFFLGWGSAFMFLGRSRKQHVKV